MGVGGGAHICGSEVPFASGDGVRQAPEVYICTYVVRYKWDIVTRERGSYCVQNLMVTLGRGNGGAVTASSLVVFMSAVGWGELKKTNKGTLVVYRLWLWRVVAVPEKENLRYFSSCVDIYGGVSLM